MLVQKGLINLALNDLDTRDKTAHAKSYIVDTLPKYAEYIFKKDGCVRNLKTWVPL